MNYISNILSSATDVINSTTAYIASLTNGNEMMAAAICLWTLGCVTYILRFIPNKIFQITKKHLTTSFTLNSANSSCYEFLKWMDETGYAGKVRSIKLENGTWGHSKTVKSIGYGNHFMWFDNQPLLINFSKEEGNQTINEKYSLMITKLGRSHAVFDKILEKIKDSDDSKKTKVSSYHGSQWSFIGSFPKRSFNSIHIDTEAKDRLIKTVDDFIKNEDWYNKHGIPYHLGILLHGPPGTGKTSIIKALAAHANKRLAVCGTYGLSFLGDIMNSAPDDSMIVIEDIDSSDVIKSRSNKYNDKPNEYTETVVGKIGGNDIIKHELKSNKNLDAEEMDKLFDSMSGKERLSSLLNAMDGIVSQHGRILIMTTNYIEKLDAAILRPGRIDASVYIGYVTVPTFKSFVKSFFPDVEDKKFENVKLKNSELTGAVLQQDVLVGLSADEICDKYLVADKSCCVVEAV